MNAHKLERLVNQIREREGRLEGESVDGFMKRTWRLALAEYETNREELPLVKALQERSERILEREIDR